jgi:peptidoglycan/LPS O-acetylase OafA/YrhL
VNIAVAISLTYFGLYRAVPLFPEIAAHLLMVFNFFSEWNGSLNGVVWTLPVEIHFYLLLPVLFFLIKRRGWAVFLIAVMVSVPLYKYVSYFFIANNDIPYKGWVFGQLPGRLDLFTCGMAGAFIYKKYQGFFTSCSYKHYLEWLLVIGGGTGILAMLYFIHRLGLPAYWDGHWSLYIWESITGVIVMLLILGICCDGKLSRILFSNPVILYIGKISYGFYLWHLMVMQLLMDIPFIAGYMSHLTPHYKFVAGIAMVMPVTMVIATLSYYLVEQPFLRRK